jgi:hypothetical protein
MTSFLSRRVVLAAASFVVAVVNIAAFPPPANNTLVRYGDMVSAIAAGTFINSGGCNFAGSNANQITSRATFVGCIQNNGSCARGGDYQMIYTDMLNCRVLVTAQTLSTDTSYSGGTNEQSCYTNVHGVPVCSGPFEASPMRLTGTVNASTSAYPVAWNFTVSSGGSCTYSITIGGVSILSGTSSSTQQTIQGSYSGGQTGTLAWSAGCPSGTTIQITGTIDGTVTYYQ